MDLDKYFVKEALIPAIIQEERTGNVLMLAYMNKESLRKTIETGYTWFYSRSRNQLWNKGETSGYVQKVIDITGDCDDDTLLILVEQTGPACHTGEKSCFFNQLVDGESPGARDSSEARENHEVKDGLEELYKVVLGRKNTFSENSYTCYLFQQGLDKILKKCGEECSEVLIAAKNLYCQQGKEDDTGAREELKNEICDLLYHLTVLMVNEELSLEEIYRILEERSQKIGNLKKFKTSDPNS